MLISRAVAIGLATLVRAFFLLALSAQVYISLSSDQAASFYQLVFFQAIIIAFLSASGFFRAQELSDDSSSISYLSTNMGLVLPSAILPLFLALFIDAYRDFGIELALIWIGAAAAALTAPVTGIVLRKQGPFAAFMPVLVSAALMIVVLVSIPDWSPLTPYIVLVSFQGLSFLILNARAPWLAIGILQSWGRSGERLNLSLLKQNGIVGTVNLANLLVIFFVRHLWEMRAAPDTVAAVFLVLRYSDTGIQVLHQVLSGQVFAFGMMKRRSTPFLLFSGGCLVAIAFVGLRNFPGSPIALALLAQVILDIVRYPASIGFLFQMQQFDMRRYIQFTLVPPLVGFACAGAFVFAGNFFAIYVLAGISVLVGGLMSARDAQALCKERTHEE